MKKLLLSSLLACGTLGVVAQQTEIFPKPQQVEWGALKAFDNTTFMSELANMLTSRTY